ncbi:GAP1-N2 domain-containing protein [Paenibacillus sp. Z6-24]
MSLLSNTPIQQQLYTREKSGIFRTTEGYDTIARSPGLDDAYIKKYLHPLCSYDAPVELSSQGEKDASLYPESLQLVRLDNRDAVLGRSQYVAADFTGLRSTFFTHNYVFASALTEEWVHHYERWLNASFRSSYDVEQGTVLEPLNELPQEPAAAADPLTVLAELNIDEALFRQMLGAVMSAIHKHRKVYISLNVPVLELPVQAKKLIGVLMQALPYAFRRRLGFTTYAKEPESRKGMQLLFVETGSIRAGDRNIERDYIFDLSNGRIQAAQAGKSGQIYIDWAWRHLNQPERLRELLEFADQGQAGIDAAGESLPDPGQYDEWTLLFRVEQGDEQLYREQQGMILQSLLKHLRPAGALESAIRLNDLFLSRFDREFDVVRNGQVPDVSIAEVFAEYYGIDPDHTGRKIVEYFIWAIRNAISSGQAVKSQAFYAMMENQPRLYEAFLAIVGSQPGLATMLLTPLIDRKFQQAQSVEEVIHLAAEWGSKYPQLLEMEDYCSRASQSFMEALRRSPDLMTATGNAFHMLEEVEQDNQAADINSEAWIRSGLGQEMRALAERFLLSELEWSSLTRERLLQADFLASPLPSDDYPELAERRTASKKLALQLLYIWFTETKNPEQVVDLLEHLPIAEKDRIQQLGRSWLGEDIRSKQFGRLLGAFSYSAQPNDMDYSGMVEEVRKQAPDSQTIYDFFRWSEDRPEFMREAGGNDRGFPEPAQRAAERGARNERTTKRAAAEPRFVPAYEAAILAYFRKYDPEAFRKGTLSKSDSGSEGPALQAVYGRARDELATPLAKWMKRNRKRLPFLGLLSVVGLAVIVGLAFYLVNVFSGDPIQVATPTTSQPGTGTESQPAADLPEVIVTLTGLPDEEDAAGAATDSTDAASPTGSNTAAAFSGVVKTSSTGTSTDTGSSTTGSADDARMVFHFTSMTACQAFQPKQATFILGTGQTADYNQLKPQSACDAPAADAGAADSSTADSKGTAGSTDSETNTDAATGTSAETNSGATAGTAATNDPNAVTKEDSSTAVTDSSANRSSTGTSTNGSGTETGSSTSGTSAAGTDNDSAALETLTEEELETTHPFTVTVSLPKDIEATNINQVKVDGKQYPVTSLTKPAGSDTETETGTETP